jgi:predicted metalloendopeptidase
LKENGNPGLIDGYTPEQRFFMSWATIWGLKQEMQQSRTSEKQIHSPGMYRAYVPLHVDTFYQAFDIKRWRNVHRARKQS